MAFYRTKMQREDPVHILLRINGRVWDMVIVSNGKKDGARPVENVASSNALASDAFMQETCSQYEMHTYAILMGMRVLCIVLSSFKGPSVCTIL